MLKWTLKKKWACRLASSGQDKEQCHALVNTEIGFMTGGEFLEQITDCQFLKAVSAQSS
jgi:hypothetical protein